MADFNQDRSAVIDETTISWIARLARLAPDKAEKEQLQAELGRIIAYFERLQQLDTQGVAPACHPHDIVNQLREDIVVQPEPRDELLQLAARQKDGCLMVPRTVE